MIIWEFVSWPVSVVLTNDVENVALAEIETGFFARDVRIILSFVSKMSSNSNLNSSNYFPSHSFLAEYIPNLFYEFIKRSLPCSL